ncbi:hypothetical protein KGA66_02085 [Actinocrinis puniceicyclus]|uniref:Integral membrane protein n=1 Tax=Actinocrinis puniceicyclus TaxID=977794 RepID=A0A8J7WJ12_9ACTN|nr:DUF6114 domain-containing protein [Actinocrinis puniceicyclus]MBS2961820.1 hypothetical protein [Actinocrinis puniceicyclus]
MTTHTLDSPASREPNQPAVLRALRAFRHWRKGRPFPAGLLIVLAGVELWLAPLSSIGNIIHEGVGGVSAFFIGALMIMFGLTVWLAPAYRVFAGIASILLGLIALPATNLGGFFIGTLLSLIGGGLAVAWTPRPGWVAPTRRERRRPGADEQQPETPAQTQTQAGESADEPAFMQAEAPAGPSAEEMAALEARTHDEAAPASALAEVEDGGADQHPQD